ncbi:hypothetical protein [Massilia horti]|uniref:Lipoprotein n=1 Tax=Massilia horti TaxID=2562153 RepID=A0A4Y9T6K3_9BURK|nr:hypothetical protein [Massilia horti]TFW36204.1 hypothetical protein E4O92_00420 [Massilia horti]
MKRLLVLAAVLLGGCAMVKSKVEPAPVAVQAKPVQGQLMDANGAPIERVAFRAGVSSATVEKLAKAHGCTGGQGAGLLTEPGPVEVYRMQCENKKVFLARCELRQCRQM